MALSRVRSIQGLYLLAPIETDPTKYALRLDVMALLERMQLIESATLARLAVSVSCRQAFPFTLHPAAPALLQLLSQCARQRRTAAGQLGGTPANSPAILPV